jgi:hypothetical protein
MHLDSKRIWIVVAALLIRVATGTAVCRADSVFFARADVVLQGSIAAQDMHQDSVPVAAFAAASPGVASATARGGAIGASSSVSTPLNASTTNSADAASGFTIHDVIFTNTTGETSFSGSANFLLRGSYSVNTADLNGLIVTSISTMQLACTVDGGSVNGAYIAEFDNGGNFQLSTSGVLSGLTGGPSSDVSVAFSVPISGQANTPTSVDCSMVVNTVASVGTTGTTDFGDPLSFAPSGPVFVLPPGWTANSISGNIVDNRFVGAAVPEPSALTLLVTGVLPLLGLAARNRRRAAASRSQGEPGDLAHHAVLGDRASHSRGATL